MYTRADPDHRAVPVLLGAVTMVCVALLLACDVFPALLPAGAMATSRLCRLP